MILIPAIDLKDGRCVRLKQGRMSDVTVFSDDPVATARHWADQGCRRLHLQLAVLHDSWGKPEQAARYRLLAGEQ